jgi:hypothetical protein
VYFVEKLLIGDLGLRFFRLVSSVCFMAGQIVELEDVHQWRNDLNLELLSSN